MNKGREKRRFIYVKPKLKTIRIVDRAGFNQRLREKIQDYLTANAADIYIESFQLNLSSETSSVARFRLDLSLGRTSIEESEPDNPVTESWKGRTRRRAVELLEEIKKIVRCHATTLSSNSGQIIVIRFYIDFEAYEVKKRWQGTIRIGAR